MGEPKTKFEPVDHIGNLMRDRDRASDACASVQRERDEAREEVDRLRSVLKSHPGWHADVTFAAIWKWLALKDEALGEDHETARYEASK